MRLLRPAGEAAGGGGVFAAFCGGGEGENCPTAILPPSPHQGAIPPRRCAATGTPWLAARLAPSSGGGRGGRSGLPAPLAPPLPSGPSPAHPWHAVPSARQRGHAHVSVRRRGPFPFLSVCVCVCVHAVCLCQWGTRFRCERLLDINYRFIFKSPPLIFLSALPAPAEG